MISSLLVKLLDTNKYKQNAQFPCSKINFTDWNVFAEKPRFIYGKFRFQNQELLVCIWLMWIFHLFLLFGHKIPNFTTLLTAVHFLFIAKCNMFFSKEFFCTNDLVWWTIYQLTKHQRCVFYSKVTKLDWNQNNVYRQ